MKKFNIILFSALLILLSLKSYTQTDDDASRIILNAYVSDDIEGLTASAKNVLLNKMEQIASANGLSGSNVVPRFILTPNITVIEKDITTTAPPMVALSLDITLYVGDGVDGIKYVSESFTVNGVGKNETKAYISAVKKLNAKSPEMQSFIDAGRNKIVEYYKQNCDFILKQAKSFEEQHEYEKAIYLLTTVPSVCTECYDKCMAAALPVYEKYRNLICQQKLTEAQAIWNAGQDIESANRVGEILVSIDPESACFNEVQNLMSQVEAKVKEIDDREWNYVIEEQSQKGAEIEAVREVGVAYGKNQPQSVQYKSLW